MSYEPSDLDTVQQAVMARTGLSAANVGIVGDANHTSGYHLGNDRLAANGRLNTDYSKRESSRDRPGTDAASAMDIGQFGPNTAGVTLRSFSVALVAACQAGDPRARDIREVIYSANGTSVSHWDRLGTQSGGDASHLYHTHISFFRSSEGFRAQPDNVLGLFIDLLGGDMDLSTIVPGTSTADAGNRSVGDVLADMYGVLMGAKRDALPTGGFNDDGLWPQSYLRDLRDRLDTLLARPAVSLDAATVATLADLVADAIIASPTNGLTTADLANVKATVKTALREGTGV